VSPHFTFGPQLLHISNTVFQNVAPLLVFGSPAVKSWWQACRHLTSLLRPCALGAHHDFGVAIAYYIEITKCIRHPET